MCLETEQNISLHCRIELQYSFQRLQCFHVHQAIADKVLFLITIVFHDIRYHYGKTVNPLDSKGNYSATSNNTKLVHRPLMGGLLHLVQRGGAWAGCGPAQCPHCCTKCNSPPSTASVPITVLLSVALPF